ncbi:hypothetical protein FGO68_gene2227 [Halteria grandinella]|uniref:Uncharacterized protein n=1 Tax=Halteria grandinella TaxID=5974 RepID=A0A8J8SWN6_HALGN|nr:hypothetical protein FGO68_gene2227 [Halteria grandinella]
MNLYIITVEEIVAALNPRSKANRSQASNLIKIVDLIEMSKTHNCRSVSNQVEPLVSVKKRIIKELWKINLKSAS